MLDDFIGSDTPFNLNDLVMMDEKVSPYPDKAITTRSAVATVLSNDPVNATSLYQSMVAEQRQGGDTLYNSVVADSKKQSETVDMKAVMGILADPSLPMEKKRAVIESIKQSQFLNDTTNALFTKGLEAPSGNENQEQESSRLSIADSIREVYEARSAVQGIVNAHAASLEGVSVKTAGEMVEHWVMPFGNSINTAKVYSAFKEQEGDTSLWNFVKGFVRPGASTMEMRQKLENTPPEKRAEIANSLAKFISNNSGIIFSNDNQFAQFSKATNIFAEGGYSDVDAWLDNMSPILDLIGLGMFARGAVKARTANRIEEAALDTSVPPQTIVEPVKPSTSKDGVPVLLGGTGKKAEEPQKQVAALFRRIEINNTVKMENPSSPAKVVQQANPDQARALHQAAITGDEVVAEAVYGTNKTDAVASDIMPQATVEGGAVISRVVDIGRNLRQALKIPEALINIIHSRGFIEFTPAEKAQARASVVRDFQSAEGLVINDAMSSFAVDGGRIKIGAVYGTAEGGFLKAEDAVAQAKLALRSYDVADENIEILAKQGLDHVPVSLDEVRGKEGNYLVRINTFSDIDPTDISRLETFDVKRNFFDRFSGLMTNQKGSVSRWIADAASMLHPIYTGAATNVSDVTAKFDKFLLSMAGEYATQWKKLSKAEKSRVDDYIREANYNGIALDVNDLAARGFSAKEVDAVKSWRKFWDAHFYLENYDLVRTLNSQGYQLFRNATTELYAKPIAKNTTLAAELNQAGTRVVGGTKLYSPAGDNVTVLTKTEIEDLYNSGGTIAKLRRPTDFSGTLAEYMIVRNTPTEYLRKFRDTDRVLNYRPGYFQLQYTAPKFVDEAVKDNAGNILYWKAIAVAGDTAEANTFKARMAGNGNEYRVRGDDRALSKDSDSWWDVESSGGRIAQRHRGQLLEDGSGLNHLGDGSYILNPVDSAIRAARSISGRTISRPMLETAKARFLNQYQHLAPSNGIGGVRWPNKLSEIGEKGNFTGSELADARTTWEYINYLENGYINGMDQLYKQFLNGLADVLSKHSPTGERLVNKMAEGDGGPISLAKNLTFSAYIGTNVLRQWIIQPHQVIRTIGYNPIGWANGQIEKYMAGYLGDKMLGVAGRSTSNPDIAAFTKFVNDSGFMDNVDKQNLVRGVLRDAADSSSRAARIASTPFNVTRRIGFDTGEMANMLGHLAAVYEKHKRAGKDLANKTARDEAYSEARAISYDMNFAGDMPYNQTSPALILQFMQVPHKAFLQLTNRRIPVGTRLRMGLTDMLFWGTPAYMISDILGKDVLPDDPFWRETLIWGFESSMMNASFEKIAGREVKIDFSSLAPYDMTGWAKVFTAFYEGGFEQMMLNSPAAGLFFKDGSRLENAAKSMARYFNILEDDDEDPETFLSVMDEVLKMSSGYNNVVKAKLLLDADKRMDQYGSAIEDKGGKLEAWMQVLGFGGSDQRDWYKLASEFTMSDKKHKEQVDQAYNDIKRMYADKLGVPDSDPKFIQKISGRLLKVFENDPVAMSYVHKKLVSDLSGKDQLLLYKMMKGAGIPDGLSEDQIRRMPIPEEQKAKAIEHLRAINAQREKMKED